MVTKLLLGSHGNSEPQMTRPDSGSVCLKFGVKSIQMGKSSQPLCDSDLPSLPWLRFSPSLISETEPPEQIKSNQIKSNQINKQA